MVRKRTIITNEDHRGLSSHRVTQGLDDHHTTADHCPLPGAWVLFQNETWVPFKNESRLWRRDDIALRERVFWRMLYETAARANEILPLDIEDLDLSQ